MTLTIEEFRDEFSSLTQGWTWEVEGFIDTKGFIYPIDTDTKVISTVFERLSSPVIRTIGKKYGYQVETSNQTTYPDFTLTGKGEHRLAVDIKTTYLSRAMVLTLGGYNSFLRNNTKNILYPYDSYHEHWILGFIYEQRPGFQEYDLDNMPKKGAIPCPYLIRSIFVRSKHDITGLRAGSGNTKNIGSIKVNSADAFHTAQGPFSCAKNPKAACDRYWKDYERYREAIVTLEDLKSHGDFREFFE